MKQTYAITITVDDDNGIVDIVARLHNIPGILAYQTAWDLPENIQVVGNRLHPDDHHEIMTYDSRDQAIGEAMTSLRDHFDDPTMYR